MSQPLTVWYNTKCPVCNAGIGWQRNRLVKAARAGAIEFRDINLEPEALARFGVGIEEVRRRLHAVDGEGRLLVGADCAARDLERDAGRPLAWLAGRPAGDPPDRAPGLRRFRAPPLRLEPPEGALVKSNA